MRNRDELVLPLNLEIKCGRKIGPVVLLEIFQICVYKWYLFNIDTEKAKEVFEAVRKECYKII